MGYFLGLGIYIYYWDEIFRGEVRIGFRNEVWVICVNNFEIFSMYGLEVGMVDKGG